MTFGLVFELDIHSLKAEEEADVVGFSGFGGEVDGFSDAFGGFLEGSGLPLGADIVFARGDLEKEIRLTVVCAYPSSIDSDTHGGRVEEIHKKIDEGFALFRLTGRMFLVSCLDVEHVSAQTASGGGSGECGIILG
jgi:hypothetical protein